MPKGFISRRRLQVSSTFAFVKSSNMFHFLRSRNRGYLFSVLGLLTMAIAIGVTAGTVKMASEKAGLYVLYVGKWTLKVACGDPLI